MAISAARTSSTISSFLPLNFMILAVSFMACHGAGCAVSVTLCEALPIFLSCKHYEQVATGNENEAVNYAEQSFHVLLAGKTKANGMLSN
jgi:hypothetical protein